MAPLPAGAQARARVTATSWSGSAAIARLSDRLPQVAARHGWSADKLEKMLATDSTLSVVPGDALVYTEPALEIDAPVEDATVVAQADDDTDEFALHSRPGSNRVIYLDFDGETLPGNGGWGSYLGSADCWAGPFNTDGNAGTFDTSERAVVRGVWERVAEDYAPFDVDVTTEDPGYAAINRTGSGDLAFGTRALITQGTDMCNGRTVIGGICAASCGGIAYVGNFDSTTSHDYLQPALVFPWALANSAKYIGEATSHEVGHNLGLSHDGETGGTTYSYGHDHWAPIMGVGYTRPITQWSKGEYANASNTQDDLAVIQDNGLSLVADDHAGQASGSTVIEAPEFSEEGIIRSSSDLDVFAISVGDGEATFSVDGAETSPNLDVSIELRDSGYQVVDSDDEPSSRIGLDQDIATGMDAEITAELTAGRYYVVVDGAGVGTAQGSGYSDYASLGRYTLHGRAVISPDPPDDPDDPPPDDPDDPPDDVAPDAPTDVIATPRNGAADITWTVPENEGTADITDYEVTIAAPGGGEPEGVTGASTRSVGNTFNWFTVTGLSNDVDYEITIAAVSDDGTSDDSEPATVTPDGTGPTTTQTYPASTWELDTSVPVSWSGTDDGAGVADYDVLRQSAAYNASLGSWADWMTGTSATSGTYSGTYGTSYCFRSRATDNADNEGAFTSGKCTSVPLASGHLQYSTGWTKQSASGAFASTYRTTTRKGATVSRSGVRARRIALVVTKCKTCGSVKVYWNDTYYKTVSLASSSTVRKQVVALLSFSKISNAGTLKIVVSSSGQAVPIEGLGVSKT
jgi:hypothetical protein